MAINLKGLTLTELEEFVASIGEKRFRAVQLYNWLYSKEVETFDKMTTMSKTLRTKLKEIASIESIKLLSISQSSEDDTTKFLFELGDGKRIESVLIPPQTAFKTNSAVDDDEQKRMTLCVSTQVGCSLNCVFCATGTMGFFRNLTTSEIVDQYLQIKKNIKKKITNIVYMGMGEPFLNYNNVMKSISIFISGMSIPARRITLSTAGWVEGIKKLADEKKKIKLAISLNSLNDSLRTQLMPVNKIFNLSELLESLKYYYYKTKMRITFEYILFSGINDTSNDIKELTQLSKTIPCKINLIPFHHFDSLSTNKKNKLKLNPVSAAGVEKFAQSLRRNYVTVFIRSSAGESINAACGQLATSIK